MVRDPVCGMEVDEKTTAYKSLYAYGVYYFCSVTCKAEFDKDPKKYLKETSATRHATHFGGYCPTPGCGAPARGIAWYLYLGLLLLLLLALFLYAL